MSGHSHFATIKRKKEITDQKRGKIFSKISREITIAAKAKGGSPETNPGLRVVIDKAKQLNMPKDNIERAIKKGTGELAGEELQEVTFEAFGPGGIAIIIEGITDNTKRTLTEIRQILIQHGGKLGGEGAVKWLFEQKGVIAIDLKEQASELQNKESMEILAIESGADDISADENLFYVYTKVEDLSKVKSTLEKKGVKTESASLDWVAKEEVPATDDIKENCLKLFEALDENDAVKDVYSNLKS